MASCPKCDGDMEEGELQGMVNWVSIPANASFLSRLRWGFKLIRVKGLRCKACGFLELYAK